MVGTAWRFTYVDSNGTKQTIAELGQQTGSYKIDRLRYILDRKNPWVMKVFAEPSLLQDFPNEVSEFQNSEPEILFEEFDGSWTIRGRFYSASQTNEENEFAIKLVDFYHKIMNQEASVSSTNTNIVDAMAKALPNGYVLDTPGDVTPPSVDNYSANNTQVRKVYRELTRDNGWSLFFMPETDSNDNWKVRFEPDGYGGTVNTLDTSTDKIKVKKWQPPKKKNLVTKAMAEGVDSNGNTVRATAENTTIRDKYLGTKSTDHNFEKVKRSYFESQSEAQRAAENKLVPGPNATEVKDTVTVADTIYPQDVVNDSFGLIDNFRNIDDTFTCVKQQNFYPANQSYLHFEFESEELEKAAEGEENLRDERARLYTNQSQNVGPLGLNVGDASAQTSSSSNNDYDNGEAQTSTSGSNDTAEAQTSSSTSVDIDELNIGDNNFSATDSDNFFSVTVPSSDWQKMTDSTATGNTDALSHKVEAQITSSDDAGFNFFWVLEQNGILLDMGYDRIETDTDGTNAVGTSGTVFWRKTRNVSLEQFENNSTNLSYDLHIKTAGGASPTLDGSISVTELNHVHNATGSTSTTDSGHGGSGDPSEHTWSGSTTDSGHGGKGQPGDHNISTSTSTTDSGHGSSTTDPHGGDTDQDSIDVSVEDKTDR